MSPPISAAPAEHHESEVTPAQDAQHLWSSKSCFHCWTESFDHQNQAMPWTGSPQLIALVKELLHAMLQSVREEVCMLRIEVAEGAPVTLRTALLATLYSAATM